MAACLGEGLLAPGLPQQIGKVGLYQDEPRYPPAETRRRLHRDRPAEGVPDQEDLVRVRWNGGFDEAGLIVERLRPVRCPGRRPSNLGA